MRTPPRAEIILDALPDEVLAGAEAALAELLAAVVDESESERIGDEGGDLRPLQQR